MPSVKFDVNIVVNGQNVIAKVSAEAKDLSKNLDAVDSDRQGYRDMLLSFNQIGQSFQNLTKGLQQLRDNKKGRKKYKNIFSVDEIIKNASVSQKG